MFKIPKIIHQTWKEKDLPSNFELLSSTWKDFHPDWEYRLWTDDMNRAFIRDNYPEFLEKYNSYPREIQRVDAVRYFILRKEGGVYIDLDFECFKNISPLLANESCVIGKEPKEHSDRFSRDIILCNAFMAATPENEFIQYVCYKVMSDPFKSIATTTDVLLSTGPFMLTEAYKQYENNSTIKVLESDLIYSLTILETRMVLKGDTNDYLQEKINHAYALHYFWGTWW